ncbi:hypothetical protein Dimus_035756 [Dionaea muscipula]
MATRRGSSRAHASFWTPVMGTRKQRSRSGAQRLGPVVTVFLDNLPERMTAKDLFMLLNKFAVVSDVFIPRKRRVVTNSRFGFARTTSMAVGRPPLDRRATTQRSKDVLTSSARERARHMLGQTKSYADALRGNRAGGDAQVAKGIHVQEERTRGQYCSPLLLSSIASSILESGKSARIRKLLGDILMEDTFSWMVASRPVDQESTFNPVAAGVGFSGNQTAANTGVAACSGEFDTPLGRADSVSRISGTLSGRLGLKIWEYARGATPADTDSGDSSFKFTCLTMRAARNRSFRSDAHVNPDHGHCPIPRIRNIQCGSSIQYIDVRVVAHEHDVVVQIRMRNRRIWCRPFGLLVVKQRASKRAQFARFHSELGSHGRSFADSAIEGSFVASNEEKGGYRWSGSSWLAGKAIGVCVGNERLRFRRRRCLRGSLANGRLNGLSSLESPAIKGEVQRHFQGLFTESWHVRPCFEAVEGNVLDSITAAQSRALYCSEIRGR